MGEGCGGRNGRAKFSGGLGGRKPATMPMAAQRRGKIFAACNKRTLNLVLVYAIATALMPLVMVGRRKLEICEQLRADDESLA